LCATSDATGYVIVLVGEVTSHDPFDPDVLLATALARPAE
jgi:hypothetical protein